MTTPTPEALALATAARLAHALDPDYPSAWACVPFVGAPTWGRRSDGRWGCNACCNGDRCDNARHGDREKCTLCDGTGAQPHRMMVIPPLPPTLAAAKAEWADAGGDPERGPALSGRSADGRVEWSVNDFGVNIRVGMLYATRRAGSMEWDFGGHGTSACLVELGRLAEAADGGAK